MTWETNKKTLLVMFVGIGMYYVCWKLNFKQMIAIEADSITLQKGVYFPKQEWQWQSSQTRLIKQASHYRMSPPILLLKHLNETVEIGEFLNRGDKKKLRENLVELGIPLISRPAG